jgi:hypothetical protein
MRYLSFFIIICFAFFWAAGCSNSLLSNLSFIKDGYQFGDLYRLSHLPQFKQPLPDCSNPPSPAKATAKKLNVYLVGDSFTDDFRMSGKDIVGENYYRVHWNSLLHIHLDTTAINVAILETVERHFRENFRSPSLRQLVQDTAQFEITPQSNGTIMQKIDRLFNAELTEERLKLILSNAPLIRWAQERKASFEFNFFERIDPAVAISKDKKHLAYHLDTDSSLINSAFQYITDSEIDSLVNNTNSIQENLIKMGFKHVVLSIIPNKATIVMPDYGKYNHLIERLYSHPKLRVPFVDVLSEFQELGENAYLLGDSHWNCTGQSIWLSKTNARINAEISRAPNLIN